MTRTCGPPVGPALVTISSIPSPSTSHRTGLSGVTRVAALLASDGSAVLALTVAWLVMVAPGATATGRTRKVAVTVTLAPAAIDPSMHGKPPPHGPEIGRTSG